MKLTTGSEAALIASVGLWPAVTFAVSCTTTANYGTSEDYQITYPWYKKENDCTLNEGADNWGVYWLQVAHNTCYAEKHVNWPVLAEDNEYGPKTKEGVRRIQAYEGGLTQDGIWGPKTGRKMDWQGARLWAEPYTKCLKLGD